MKHSVYVKCDWWTATIIAYSKVRLHLSIFLSHSNVMFVKSYFSLFIPHKHWHNYPTNTFLSFSVECIITFCILKIIMSLSKGGGGSNFFQWLCICVQSGSVAKLKELLILHLSTSPFPQDLFQAGDSSQRGRISLETLRDLIGRSQNKPPVDENSAVWNTIMDSLCPVSW